MQELEGRGSACQWAVHASAIEFYTLQGYDLLNQNEQIEIGTNHCPVGHTQVGHRNATRQL